MMNITELLSAVELLRKKFIKNFPCLHKGKFQGKIINF